MYRVRIPIAIGLLSLLGGVLWLDHHTRSDTASAVAIVLLVGAALWEFNTLIGLPRGIRIAATLTGLLLLTGTHLQHHPPGWLAFDPVPAILAIASIGILAPVLLGRDPDSPETPPGPGLPEGGLRHAAGASLGLFYVAFLLSYLLEIRYLRIPGSTDGATDGIALLLFVVLSAKGADMGGYLVGKKFGRHKILPRISPKKSVEGTIAGLLLSAVLAAVVASQLPPLAGRLSPSAAAGFGVVAGALSLLGDLVESSIKRRVGAKDSGQLIPEFGGILDLLDSLMFAAPAGYYFLSIWLDGAAGVHAT